MSEALIEELKKKVSAIIHDDVEVDGVKDNLPSINVKNYLKSENFRIFDETTGKSTIKNNADNWFKILVTYQMDDKTLAVCDKTRPTLNEKQTKYFKELSDDSKEFYKKFGTLSVLYSVVTAIGPDAKQTSEAIANRVDSELWFDRKKVIEDYSSPAMLVQYQDHYFDIIRFLMAEKNKSEEIQKYFNNRVKFAPVLYQILMSNETVDEYAHKILNAKTDEAKSAIYQDLKTRIDLIDPTCKMSTEFLHEVMSLLMVFLGSELNNIPFLGKIIEETLNRVLNKLEIEDVNGENYKMFKLLAVDFVDPKQAKQLIVSIVQDFLTKPKPRPAVYEETPMTTFTSTLEAGISESIPLMLGEEAPSEAIKTKWLKNSVLKNFCGALAVTAMGVAVFYGIKNWEDLKAFDKALIVGEIYIMFLEVSRGIGWGLKVIASKLPSITEKMAAVAIKASISATTKFFVKAAAKLALSIVPLFNLAIIGYDLYNLTQATNFTEGFFLSLVLIADIASLIAEYTGFYPIAIVFDFLSIVFSFFATLFGTTPWIEFKDAQTTYKLSDSSHWNRVALVYMQVLSEPLSGPGSQLSLDERKKVQNVFTEVLQDTWYGLYGKTIQQTYPDVYTKIIWVD